jgi:DHA1 family tetracycline resistance protein-like MFS transporter
MPPKQRSQNAATVFIVFTILIDAIGFGIIIPVLPKLVMTLGHLDLASATRVGGWMAAVYAIMQFLCGPLAGNLGDRFGRRPVLLLALAGFTVDYLLLGFAPTLAWLFAGRLIAGIFGASFGPATAALADITPPADRAKRFGLVGAAFGLGFIIGPAVGGLLGELSPRAPFYAAATCSALNFLFGMFLFPETLDEAHRRPFELKRANPVGALMAARKMPGVLGLAAILLLWNIASMVYPATWAYFTIAQYGWTPGMIGSSLAFVGVTMVIVQSMVLGRVVKKIGERRSAMLGVSIATAGYLGLAFTTSPALAFVILGLTALQGLVQPSVTAMMSQRAPANAQGEMQGFVGSLNAIGSIAAPLLLNPALAHFTAPNAPVRFPGAAFIIAAAFAAAALISLWMARNGKKIVVEG